MRKAPKEQVASRIFARGPGSGASGSVETREIIQPSETEATFLVPTFVLFLAASHPRPLPMESGLGNIAFIDGEYKQA